MHKGFLRSVVLVLALGLIFGFCVSFCFAKDGNLVAFRIYNSDTGKTLSNTTISIYDGFDARFAPYAGPFEPDNSPYYFADKKTSSDGLLQLDISQFKNNTILLKANQYYKYIDNRNKQITVIHYRREDYSLNVVAHHIYNLETKMVTIIRFPDKVVEEPKAFTYIDIPLD